MGAFVAKNRPVAKRTYDISREVGVLHPRYLRQMRSDDLCISCLTNCLHNIYILIYKENEMRACTLVTEKVESLAYYRNVSQYLRLRDFTRK